LKKNRRNRSIRTQSKTSVIKVDKLIKVSDFTAAEEALRQAVSILDKAAQKRVIHPNSTARRKSHLMKSLKKDRAESSTAKNG
jgi:small subunit ribosomal protein S20